MTQRSAPASGLLAAAYRSAEELPSHEQVCSLLEEAMQQQQQQHLAPAPLMHVPGPVPVFHGVVQL